MTTPPLGPDAGPPAGPPERASPCDPLHSGAGASSLRSGPDPPPEVREALAALALRDGVWAWDLANGTCHYSEEWKSLLGYTGGEVGDRPDEWLRRVHPEDVPVLRAALAGLLDGRLSTADQIQRVLHRDGEYRSFRWRGLALGGSNSPPPLLAGLLSPSTRSPSSSWRARAERERHERLSALVAAGHLAGGVAHDFNNLLMVILGYCDFLAGVLGPDHPLHGDVQAIRAAGHQATALTRKLMTLSRLHPDQPARLDLREFLRELAATAQELSPDPCALAVVSPDRPVVVLADRGQLQRVLLDLVIASREVAGPGGKILVEAQAPAAVAGDCPTVALEVSVRGSGADRVLLQFLLEPLGSHFEVEHDVEDRSEGLTRVCVGLPVVLDERRTPSRGSAGRETSPERRRTILLVEDNDLVRSLVQHILADQGYEVLVAASGDEAMAIGEEHFDRIELLLTDVVMPGMGGGDLARRLADLVEGLRVLFMSGYTGEELLRHGVREDLELVPKPFTPEELGRKVREAFQGPPWLRRGEAPTS